MIFMNAVHMTALSTDQLIYARKLFWVQTGYSAPHPFVHATVAGYSPDLNQCVLMFKMFRVLCGCVCVHISVIHV